MHIQKRDYTHKHEHIQKNRYAHYRNIYTNRNLHTCMNIYRNRNINTYMDIYRSTNIYSHTLYTQLSQTYIHTYNGQLYILLPSKTTSSFTLFKFWSVIFPPSNSTRTFFELSVLPLFSSSLSFFHFPTESHPQSVNSTLISPYKRSMSINLIYIPFRSKGLSLLYPVFLALKFAPMSMKFLLH